MALSYGYPTGILWLSYGKVSSPAVIRLLFVGHFGLCGVRDVPKEVLLKRHTKIRKKNELCKKNANLFANINFFLYFCMRKCFVRIRSTASDAINLLRNTKIYQI